jgi:hypothetical protein
MSDADMAPDRDEELARRIHEEAQRDPHSPYAYKCVGIVNGQVVAVADDWDELERRLQEIELDDPRQCLWARIDPNTDFGEENEIWGLH